jgi:hypothetical protein
MVPFPDTSKLSAIAEELERRFPSATVGEIYAMAKQPVESAIAVAAGQGSRKDGVSLSSKKLTFSISNLFSESTSERSICCDTQSTLICSRYSSTKGRPLQTAFAASNSSTPTTTTSTLDTTSQSISRGYPILRYGFLVQHFPAYTPSSTEY